MPLQDVSRRTFIAHTTHQQEAVSKAGRSWGFQVGWKSWVSIPVNEKGRISEFSFFELQIWNELGKLCDEANQNICWGTVSLPTQEDAEWPKAPEVFLDSDSHPPLHKMTRCDILLVHVYSYRLSINGFSMFTTTYSFTSFSHVLCISYGTLLLYLCPARDGSFWPLSYPQKNVSAKQPLFLCMFFCIQLKSLSFSTLFKTHKQIGKADKLKSSRLIQKKTSVQMVAVKHWQL